MFSFRVTAILPQGTLLLWFLLLDHNQGPHISISVVFRTIWYKLYAQDLFHTRYLEDTPILVSVAKEFPCPKFGFGYFFPHSLFHLISIAFRQSVKTSHNINNKERIMSTSSALFDHVAVLTNQVQTLELLKNNNSAKMISIDSLPSLCESESSEASSCLSQDEGERPSLGRKKRSIFSQYWKTNRVAPSSSTPLEHASALTEVPPTSLEPESVPPATPSPRRISSTTSLDDSCQASTPMSPRRRSILPAVPQSPATIKRSLPPRRIQSTSELETVEKTTKSCLRESRFSGRKSRSCSISELSSSSVRFDMDNIDVVHFEPPMEIFAQPGWCEHFA